MNPAAYPHHKVSRIEWLGEVPSHWDEKPLKHLADIDSCGSYGIEPEGAEIVLPVATTAQIDSDGRFAVDEMPQRGFVPLEVERYGCAAGDILVVKSSGSGTNIISGKAGLVDEFTPHFVFSNFLMRVRPVKERAVPKFVFFLLRSDLTRQRVELMCSTTTYPNLQIGEYTSVLLPVPSIPEQEKIAAFLDWKTEQIDALIARKKELLEKLKEERLAVITQAVTQGLNPAAPMRDSGIPWLGKVPQHWEVNRIKFVGRVGNGSTPSRENPLYWDNGDYPWLNSSVVNQEAVTMADQFVTADALAECHLPIVHPPAVLIGITGEGKTRGMATTLLFEATINQHLAYFKPDPSQAVVGFVRRVFDMAYAYLRSESEGGGSTKGAITCEQITEMSIPVPPIVEQEAIAKHVDAETQRIDRMTIKIEAAIDRLTEYRIALITSATTGKIDVRKVKLGSAA
ncbi:MAG: restriction endonuclease subunit S [Nitrospira sp.]|nr:restriction endonuclease subunit S [Nitrospira sp.]